MHPTFSALLAALLLPASALAQSSQRPDPLDAKTAVAPLVHRSAFSGYKPLTGDVPLLSWREANDAVERVGGWRAYAREANAPAASSPAPAASAPAPAPRASRPATPASGQRQ